MPSTDSPACLTQFISFKAVTNLPSSSPASTSAWVAICALPLPPSVADGRTTAPVIPSTDCTASVGVSSSCQLARVEAPTTRRMKLLFRSVRTATSPISAVRASMAAWVLTTKVSVMAVAGIWATGTLPPLSRVATPLAAPFWLLGTASVMP
ncbi:hypothetical protein D3C77_519590 [compost metagenome]